MFDDKMDINLRKPKKQNKKKMKKKKEIETTISH